jgi:glycosyltransferase involved in cell wall biosynthesis
VQVEGMIAGVPAVASDLPGVRQPVRTTGFGVVVPPRDSVAITRALEHIAGREDDVPAMAALAKELYGVETVTRAYEDLFASPAG